MCLVESQVWYKKNWVKQEFYTYVGNEQEMFFISGNGISYKNITIV